MPESRSTFREKAEAVCWQKQLRDRYLSEGVPPVPHLDVKRSIVRPVSRKLAEQVILKYEWLGTMARTRLHYGIFYGEYCAGVTCVSVGSAMAGINHHRQFGVSRNQVLTLARGACVHWAPPGSNSRLVAWTCRLLSKAKAGKLVWATSDSDAGEIGTIYQACGWTYIGPTARKCKDQEYITPKGRILNNRCLSSYAKANGVRYSAMSSACIDAGWSFQRSNPKHRYVQILDRSDVALSARVEHMRRPYPKRAGSGPADTPANHAGEGGSTPTPALFRA